MSVSLPSFSPLALAVVSVESQLSCSAPSGAVAWARPGPEPAAVVVPGPVEEAVGWAVEALEAPVASVAVSASVGLLVHCRAFFCRVAPREI